ncbi:MAG: GNAT family N-acetyltransferase [Gammaproteobacteria bacterium]|nr:GNAT family N-acetyltransferase [Gammaproteobacteria bacterium]
MNRLLDDTETQLKLLTGLRLQAIDSHHRRMVVIAGELDWSLQLANTFIDHLSDLSTDSKLWIAQEGPEPSNRLQQLIGGESQLLLFNAHHGFDPNLFGAATGTVTGGGLVLLLTPSFEMWRKKSDPVSSRITVYPHPAETISNHYIERLILSIENGAKESLTTIIEQSTSANPGTELPSAIAQQPREPSPTESREQMGSTTDQQLAIEAIIHTATGHRHRPLVITADRGRGKSAALGIAAAQLIKAGKRHIIVTAPGRAAVDNLFKHAESELSNSGNSSQLLSLEFIAPDQLINRPIKADLVLVDEAAAIPAPILSIILEHHARVIFSTTTHGYEGSGQGFALRFLKKLKAQCPNYNEIKLKSPIRWADGDPVEKLVNQMLILDAEPELPEGLLSMSIDQIEHINRVDRAQLGTNETLLRQLFGLLVLAHYRTTPLDLRQLLDGPNLTIYTIIHNNSLVATALVADEGEIDAPLANEIWLGKRRPQGHLLPQTLIAHLGIKEAAPLRYRRIIRIAVHPKLQRRGLGKKLIEKICSDAVSEQIDILGTSYGATRELIQFWKQNRLTPIFIGSHRNASSGSYALTQMRAISDRGKLIFSLAESRFQNGLVDQLRAPLQQLESDIIHLLLKPHTIELESHNPHDLSDIEAFIHGNRRYETVITPLIQLLLRHFHKIGSLDPNHRQLLILRLLQNRPWDDCATLLKIDGKNALQRELRIAISKLAHEYTQAP